MSMTDLNAPPKDKGGSRFKDTELNCLALNANRFIIWPMVPDAPDEHSPLLKCCVDPINLLLMANRPTGQYKNVYPMGGGTRSNKYVVELPIGGKSFRIFIGTHRFRCARYADAAKLYFWKYRKADRPPLDSDFNTSVAIATQLMNLPACLVQLSLLEDYLLRSGEIQTPERKATEQKVRTFLRDLRTARKYLERSRRCLRIFRERYALPADKIDSILRVESAIDLMLDAEFSRIIQPGAEDIVAQMRVETAAAPAAKSAFEILLDQQSERARKEREENSKLP